MGEGENHPGDTCPLEVCMWLLWVARRPPHLGNPLVAVVKQGLQIGTCVYSGCGHLHFATNDICLAPRLNNLAHKTWIV